MSFIKKTWAEPIQLDAQNINRIEQGIKNAYDNIEILKEELHSLQLTSISTQDSINTLSSTNPNILETLNNVSNILNTNSNILETLQDANSVLTKTPQTLTSEELEQVHDNLGINKFLHLTDIKVNDTSIIKGSEVNITVPIIDTKLDRTSNNAVANKALVKELERLETSFSIHNHDTQYSLLSHKHSDIEKRLLEISDSIENNIITYEDIETYGGKLDKISVNGSSVPIINRSADIKLPTALSQLTNDSGFISETDAKAYTNSMLSKLIDNAPNDLSTLKQLADAIITNNSTLETLSSSINNKAPISHTHTESEITDFKNYASNVHTHITSDIINLDTLLQGYAKTVHTHPISEIENLPAYSPITHTHSISDITNLPSYSLSTHNHNDIYSLLGHTHNDIYSQLGHIHTISDLINMPNYSLDTHTHDSIYSKITHEHVINDITDFPDLSKYSLTTHTHDYLSLSGGTITSGAIIKLNATSASNSASIKWATLNNKTPYIGYATDQTDGTLLISTENNTKASGLSVGDILQWKGVNISTETDLINLSTTLTNNFNTSFNNFNTILGLKLQVVDYYIDPTTLAGYNNADVTSASYVTFNKVFGDKKLTIIWGTTPETDNNGYLQGAPTQVGWVPTSSEGIICSPFTDVSQYRVQATIYGGTQFHYGWRIMHYINNGIGGFNIRYGNSTSGIRYSYIMLGLHE